MPLEKLGLPGQYITSDSAGERLAAVLALQTTPDPRYLRGLSERVWVEARFVGLMVSRAPGARQDLADEFHRRSVEPTLPT